MYLPTQSEIVKMESDEVVNLKKSLETRLAEFRAKTATRLPDAQYQEIMRQRARTIKTMGYIEQVLVAQKRERQLHAKRIEERPEAHRESWLRAFVNVANKNLPTDVFDSLCDAADQRVIDQATKDQDRTPLPDAEYAALLLFESLGVEVTFTMLYGRAVNDTSLTRDELRRCLTTQRS